MSLMYKWLLRNPWHMAKITVMHLNHLANRHERQHGSEVITKNHSVSTD